MTHNNALAGNLGRHGQVSRQAGVTRALVLAHFEPNDAQLLLIAEQMIVMLTGTYVWGYSIHEPGPEVGDASINKTNDFQADDFDDSDNLDNLDDFHAAESCANGKPKRKLQDKMQLVEAARTPTAIADKAMARVGWILLLDRPSFSEGRVVGWNKYSPLSTFRSMVVYSKLSLSSEGILQYRTRVNFSLNTDRRPRMYAGFWNCLGSDGIIGFAKSRDRRLTPKSTVFSKSH